MKPIQIVDLFAGPGGLGEGFSSLSDSFEIVVSAEMTSAAHSTLRLRAFFRLLKSERIECINDYYNFCNGLTNSPWTENTKDLWERAGQEARQIELGTEKGNNELDEIINSKLDKEKHWVLIGGPPCQAYSLVGRSRNVGKSGYKAEDDHRNFLYKEYLRIIQKYSPSVFVMENVKGILSAKVNGRSVFHDILRDLAFPDEALEINGDGEKYRICSLVNGDTYHYGDNPASFDARKFIIRAEEFGIPQARHRVILLGIKESLLTVQGSLMPEGKIPVKEIIGKLPPLRSKLTRQQDSLIEWQTTVSDHITDLIYEIKKGPAHLSELLTHLGQALNDIQNKRDSGSVRYPLTHTGSSVPNKLEEWYYDSNLEVLLNHEARGHMSDDLKRYVFASCYAKAFGHSPKGHKDFSLPGLRPAHKNWESGKFADRFRVQTEQNPSTTVTSHISKDGHYFIHPDPGQCRSLTVREAARLQTFPDNYFFLGNRTEQFHQVGNAVPPLLAHKIAKIVEAIIKNEQPSCRTSSNPLEQQALEFG